MRVIRHRALLALSAIALINPISASGRTLRRTSVRNAEALSLQRREDPCEYIFQNSDKVLLATDIEACATTVPFNQTVAAQLVSYLRDTISFQSTLAYLSSPPSSYQQPSTDILANLDGVANAVEANAFLNELDFETAVLRTVYAAHDSHLFLDIGVSSLFSYGSSYEIVTVSVDGIQRPQPYLSDDVQRYLAGGPYPSPITKINSLDADMWLSAFAADNCFGFVEPHADWNALMHSPVADIQAIPPTFNGGIEFNPGSRLEFVMENGTVVTDAWKALVQAPFDTPALASGQEVFNYFVLAQSPNTDSSAASTGTSAPTTAPSAAMSTSSTSGTAAAATSDASPNASPTNWYQAMGVTAYPTDPVTAQPNLGNGGVLTGYFLDDPSLAVLSVPSFDVGGTDIATFSQTVNSFLDSSVANSKSKIVIDLQQNYGGNLLLAIDMFKQFFPDIDPFGGSRIRGSKAANALGLTFTQFWQAHQGTLNQSWVDELTASPWAVLDYINPATNKSFASWEEFLTDVPDHGDVFSTVQRDNLSDPLFAEVNTGGFDPTTGQEFGIKIHGYGAQSSSKPRPFAADSIVLLTDGVCHSACAVFAEMMVHEAGARSIVVGGQPSSGPMQLVGGSRGALQYNSFLLDNDIYLALELNGSNLNQLPASHFEEMDFEINEASFNLRDQIRRDSDTPLQFVYEAAECRFFWTMATIMDMAALWQYAADATWHNQSMCVRDSTIFANDSRTDLVGPTPAQLMAWGVYSPPKGAAILPPSALAANATASLAAASTTTALFPASETTLPANETVPVEDLFNVDPEEDYGPAPSSFQVQNAGFSPRTAANGRTCGPSRSNCGPTSGCFSFDTCDNSGQAITGFRCQRACISPSFCSSFFATCIPGTPERNGDGTFRLARSSNQAQSRLVGSTSGVRSSGNAFCVPNLRAPPGCRLLEPTEADFGDEEEEDDEEPPVNEAARPVGGASGPPSRAESIMKGFALPV